MASRRLHEEADDLEDAFRAALRNIAAWGDTDVFPLPPENLVLFDSEDAVVDLLKRLHIDFEHIRNDDPPANANALAMVGYTAFRWVTQIDPIWNAYLLGLVLSIADRIEGARVSREQAVVFSYRYQPDEDDHKLFADSAWRAFNVESVAQAEHHSHMVACDIADFYPRIYHHRLENSLLALKSGDEVPRRILRVLSMFSDAHSYGLPVGGPAARILSEILLNRVDRLLLAEGITFCRFADDYHLFVDSREAAYDALRFLTEKLLQNEGLSLQRAKTRILTARDFLASSAFSPTPEGERNDETPHERDQRNFLSLSLRYDPYSPTAREDYEELRDQIERFDIVGMLARELTKSRIHTALTRRLLQALQYLRGPSKDGAIRSIFDSIETLTPVFPNVALATSQVFNDLDSSTQAYVIERVRDMIIRRRYYVMVPVNLAYAVRLLGQQNSEDNAALLAQIFDSSPPFVQRDIVIIMGNWRATWWLSDQRKQYLQMHPWVRRAMMISSFQLNDEGDHWRRRTSGRFSAFDRVVETWASSRARNDNWQVPL